MDPEANKIEQARVARRILDLWDTMDENPEATRSAMEKLAHEGYRLAELVEALLEWERRTP